MEDGRSSFRILAGTPTGKRPLGRPRRRWEDNTRMDLKKWVSIRGTGLIRLWIGVIGEPLWMRHWTSGFHKTLSYLVNQWIHGHRYGVHLVSLGLHHFYSRNYPTFFHPFLRCPWYFSFSGWSKSILFSIIQFSFFFNLLFTPPIAVSDLDKFLWKTCIPRYMNTDTIAEPPLTCGQNSGLLRRQHKT